MVDWTKPKAYLDRWSAADLWQDPSVETKEHYVASLGLVAFGVTRIALIPPTGPNPFLR